MKYNVKYNISEINTYDKLYYGESIERKCERVLNNNEAIESISPMIYTEKKDGVRPEHDIRADKWDIAQKSMDFVTKKKIEKRKSWLENKVKSDEPSQ